MANFTDFDKVDEPPEWFSYEHDAEYKTAGFVRINKEFDKQFKKYIIDLPIEAKLNDDSHKLVKGYFFEKWEEERTVAFKVNAPLASSSILLAGKPIGTAYFPKNRSAGNPFCLDLSNIAAGMRVNNWGNYTDALFNCGHALLHLLDALLSLRDFDNLLKVQGNSTLNFDYLRPFFWYAFVKEKAFLGKRALRRGFDVFDLYNLLPAPAEPDFEREAKDWYETYNENYSLFVDMFSFYQALFKKTTKYADDRNSRLFSRMAFAISMHTFGFDYFSIDYGDDKDIKKILYEKAPCPTVTGFAPELWLKHGTSRYLNDGSPVLDKKEPAKPILPPHTLWGTW